MQKSTKR